MYLDHHATTPVDKRVLEAMLPYFTECFGNAASRSHQYGWTAEAAVARARQQVADLLGADEREIIFTSGATESNNLAILGSARMLKDKGRHIVTSAIEHKAVLDSCHALEAEGFDVTYLMPDKYGRTSVESVASALRPDTILVSIMAAHHEVGTLNPVTEIGALCKAKKVVFHTDAVQAAGKIPIDVEAMQVDLLTISAHKMYGPKGVGALYVRRRAPRIRLAPLIHGGGQERGMRSGTLNVPGIVGIGAACELSQSLMMEEMPRIRALRDALWEYLSANLSHIVLNGHPTDRLAGNLNVSFSFVEGESLMMGIKELAVSSGSACTSASLEPSYVLKNMGVGDDLAHTSIRFGLGRGTTREEIEKAGHLVVEAVERLRELSPLYEMVQEGVDLSQVAWSGH